MNLTLRIFPFLPLKTGQTKLRSIQWPYAGTHSTPALSHAPLRRPLSAPACSIPLRLRGERSVRLNPDEAKNRQHFYSLVKTIGY